ncbi:MAG: hypothetical protein ACYCOR_08955 [Acidobacteriaceae bacterium]
MPRLTTIRQPLSYKGELAADTVLEKISGNNGVPKLLKIQPELVARETTGACPKPHKSPTAAKSSHR